MSNETKLDLNSWDDFVGKFIKAEVIKIWPALFVPTSVSGEFDDDGNANLIYIGDFQGKKKFWQPNKTNIDIIKKSGIPSPSALLGKKVYFKRVMNFNPQLKQKVPSVEVEKVE